MGEGRSRSWVAFLAVAISGLHTHQHQELLESVSFLLHTRYYLLTTG